MFANTGRKAQRILLNPSFHIKIHIGQAEMPLRNMYLILRNKYCISNKYFYFSQIWMYILKIHLSTWNLDYMIPKGIRHTSVQNPTYEFQKRTISSIQENISSIQNYQELSFLPVTLTSMADLFPWQRLTWTALWDSYVSALMVQWQNTCLWCKGASNLVYYVFFYFFMMTSLGA